MRRTLLAAAGLAAMAAAGYYLVGQLPAGFPDGYISPYDRATLPWITGLAFALLISGIFTLAAAIMSKPGRATIGLVAALLVGGSVLLLDGCPQLGWCVAAVQQFAGVFIDDGTGG